MKVGTEVEGRFKGIQTLFVSAEEATHYFSGDFEHAMNNLQSILDFSGPNHKPLQVYISDHDNELDFSSSALANLDEVGLLVTIEVTAMDEYRERYPANVSFILSCVDTVEPSDYTKSFFHLKDTDQVKFSQDQFVFCATKESFIKTQPKDFEADIEIDTKALQDPK